MAQDDPNWFQEYLTPHLSQSISIDSKAFSGKTTFQQVDILDTPAFGRCLILDGKIQSAEFDEFIYHEALVQPALTTHPSPKSVFIAGGGEGATLREALSHSDVELAVIVDLDEEVVSLCKYYLPSYHSGAFDAHRTKLYHTDAGQYLQDTNESYDVIIIDLPDPQEGGPASLLYTQGFYQLLRQRLNPNGILTIQSEACAQGNTSIFTAINKTLSSVFPQVFPYKALIPSFATEWGFNMASLGPSPLELSVQQIDTRLTYRDCNDLRFYDGQTHKGLFTLPKNIRTALDQETRVITDYNPIVPT